MRHTFSFLRSSLTKFVTHSGFRRYFFNTSWLFAEQMLRIISGLLIGIYVARYLGPQQFGIYSYAVAYVALVSAIAKLGLDSIVVRELIKYPQKTTILLGTAFWLKIAGAILAMLTLLIAVHSSGNDATTKLYIFIIASGLVFQSFEVADFYFQSQVKSKYISISKLIQLFISSILKLYFIFHDADLIWFVIISLIDQCTLAFCSTVAYLRHKVGAYWKHVDLGLARSMFADAWPLILSGLAITIYMRIDQVMIKDMLGNTEVGIYSAAVRISEAWNFIPIIIASSLFPSLVNARKNDHYLYLQRLQKLCNVMTWLAFSVALTMTFLSDWLVLLLYGPNYQAAGHILAIHIWGSVFIFMGVSTNVYFTIENITKNFFWRTASGGILNIVLNYFLIPYCGISGAAIATVISQFFSNYFYDLFDTKIRDILIIKTRALFPVTYFFNKKL